MKLRTVLRKMNKIDKAVLFILALCFLSGALFSGISVKNEDSEMGSATLFFAEDASFGKEALPGSPVADARHHTVGYVTQFSPTEEGVLLTLTTNADFQGAVGESVFLRGKSFEGTGKIKSLIIGDSYDSR